MLNVILMLLPRLPSLRRLLKSRELLLPLAGRYISVTCGLSAFVLDFLVPLLLCLLPPLSLHVFVLYRVDGRNAQLQLGQYSEPLWLGHLAVVILELMECIASQAERRLGDSRYLNGCRGFGVGLRTFVCPFS